jgi:hypothetical protein
MANRKKSMQCPSQWFFSIGTRHFMGAASREEETRKPKTIAMLVSPNGKYEVDFFSPEYACVKSDFVFVCFFPPIVNKI